MVIPQRRVHPTASSIIRAFSTSNHSSIMAADRMNSDGVCDPRPAMSGADPMDQGAYLSPRLALGQRRAPGDPGGDVAEDVPEEVRRDDDVEPLGFRHQVVAGSVDEHIVEGDVRQHLPAYPQEEGVALEDVGLVDVVSRSLFEAMAQALGDPENPER